MGTYTTIRSFYKPDAGETGWDALINAIFDELDGDIDVEGKIKIWPSGGLSFANTVGGHADPGDDVVTFHQTDVNFEGSVHFNGGGQFPATIDLPVSTLDVSNPPTDSELAGEFGAPNNGFTILIDDNGAGTDVYLATWVGGVWWTATLTEAI